MAEEKKEGYTVYHVTPNNDGAVWEIREYGKEDKPLKKFKERKEALKFAKDNYVSQADARVYFHDSEGKIISVKLETDIEALEEEENKKIAAKKAKKEAEAKAKEEKAAAKKETTEAKKEEKKAEKKEEAKKAEPKKEEAKKETSKKSEGYTVYHVTPNNDGEVWEIREYGKEDKPLKKFKERKEALKYAKDNFVGQPDARVYFHDVEGKIMSVQLETDIEALDEEENKKAAAKKVKKESETKTSKTEHKVEHKVEHKAEHKSEHKVEHKAEPKKKAVTVKRKVKGYEPRFKTKYFDTVVPNLIEKYKYTSVMAVPHIEKIVINIGLGDAVNDKKVIENSTRELSLITGQHPVITRAKKSIATFKLRQGEPIGCKVTLRGVRMYEFFDKLVSIALPRVRDFRGVSSRAFDGNGNYTLGVKEQLIFPEIDYDKVAKVRGMDIVIVTTARTNDEAKSLLDEMGMPFHR